MRFDELDLEYLLSGEICTSPASRPPSPESCHDLIERLLSAANERGVVVSFDVNVRRLLFEGRDPRKVLLPLAARADLLFLSDDEADLLFGGSDPDSLKEARRDIRAETVVVHHAKRPSRWKSAAFPRRPRTRWKWWTPWGG